MATSAMSAAGSKHVGLRGYGWCTTLEIKYCGQIYVGSRNCGMHPQKSQSPR